MFRLQLPGEGLNAFTREEITLSFNGVIIGLKVNPPVLNGDFQFGLAVETGIVKRYLIILFRPGSRLYVSRGVVCVQ